jgi:hypothetical protein
MKKYIKFTIIFLFLLENQIYSQIKINGFIETGYHNGKVSIYNGCLNRPFGNIVNYNYNNLSFFSTINLNASYKCINVNQTLNNSFFYKSGYSFSTQDIEFITEISINYKNISFAYSHICLHPVKNTFFDNDINNGLMRIGLDKFSIRLKFKN